MVVMNVIAPMGKGKTLFASLYAKMYAEKFPTRNIYANYHLNLQNAVFTPCMFLPFRKLKECLIIFDDLYSSKNLARLIGIIVNLSRKQDIEIILTCQYYAMIPKMIRTLSTQILVEFDNTRDQLNVAVEKIIDEDSKSYNFYAIRKISERAKDLYDTNEVVEFSTPTKVCEEIMKFSETIEDLELNVSLYTNNQSKIRSLTKELAEKMGFEYKINPPKKRKQI